MEDNILAFIVFLPVFILLLIGWLIKYKKAYWLISGYNTMSKEKKKNVDIDSLGKFIANVCFSLAGLISIAMALMLMEKTLVAIGVFMLIIPLIIYVLIKAQDFDGNTKNEEGKMKRGTKVVIGVVSVILVLTMIGAGVMLYFSSIQNEYKIEGDTLVISGFYGIKIPLKKIEDIYLKDTMPEVITKLNGSGLDSKLKGNFKLKDVGNVKLFVDKAKESFIYIKYDSKLVILNCENVGETEKLIDDIVEAMRNKK